MLLFLLCFLFQLFRDTDDTHGWRPQGRFCFSLIFDRLGAVFCRIGRQDEDPLVRINESINIHWHMSVSGNIVLAWQPAESQAAGENGEAVWMFS